MAGDAWRKTAIWICHTTTFRWNRIVGACSTLSVWTVFSPAPQALSLPKFHSRKCCQSLVSPAARFPCSGLSLYLYGMSPVLEEEVFQSRIQHATRHPSGKNRTLSSQTGSLSAGGSGSRNGSRNPGCSRSRAHLSIAMKSCTLVGGCC